MTLLQKLMAFFVKNWKTTLGGLLIFLIGILVASEVITKEVGATIITILTGLGFVAAKDGDKTGV